jgi:hypothetical protein
MKAIGVVSRQHQTGNNVVPLIPQARVSVYSRDDRDLLWLGEYTVSDAATLFFKVTPSWLTFVLITNKNEWSSELYKAVLLDNQTK